LQAVSAYGILKTVRIAGGRRVRRVSSESGSVPLFNLV